MKSKVMSSSRDMDDYMISKERWENMLFESRMLIQIIWKKVVLSKLDGEGN